MPSFSALQTELKNRLMDTTDSLWSLDNKKRYINAAIRYANDAGARRTVVDESLVVVANAVEYDLPLTILSADALFRVSVEGDANTPYAIKSSWDVREKRVYTGGYEDVFLTLVLQKAFDEAAGKIIRLEYLGYHQELAAATDTTSLPAEYILAYALFMAHTETRTRTDVDRKEHEKEQAKWLPLAEARLERLLLQQPSVGGRVIGQVV